MAQPWLSIQNRIWLPYFPRCPGPVPWAIHWIKFKPAMQKSTYLTAYLLLHSFSILKPIAFLPSTSFLLGIATHPLPSTISSPHGYLVSSAVHANFDHSWLVLIDKIRTILVLSLSYTSSATVDWFRREYLLKVSELQSCKTFWNWNREGEMSVFQ